MACLQWLDRDIRACCPLCGEQGPKGAVLAVDHVLPGHPRVTLLRCPACGVAFLEDLTPPDYETSLAVQLDYYVEQGAGIDCIVAPLLRLPPESVRRFLDVGCSFGFALDFSRFAFGWEVLGVDPSPLAAAGAAALDVPVRRSYFSADLDLGPEPFDLVLCSEILEHLAEPLALLVAMRERLSPEGLLVLSTPNLAVVRRETEEGVLGRALSPGLHLMLYDRGSLSLLLAKAGFSEVRIEESPETLRAFAACSPSALERLRPAEPAPDRAVLRDYFGSRAAGFPLDSSLACGFAWRHFKECVNAGLHEEAAASRAVLARIYQARFELDLERPADIALQRRSPRPFNLAGTLFFSGILELNGLRRPDRAAECFSGAVVAGNALLEEQRPFGLCDGETEAFTELGRTHLPMALAAIAATAAIDRDRLVREAPAAPTVPAVPDRSRKFVRAVRQLFKRSRPSPGPSPGRLVIAERFVAPVARLSAVVLPLDVIAQQPSARLRLAVFAEGTADVRVATLVQPPLSSDEGLRLVFAPFEAPADATFCLGVLDLSEGTGHASIEANMEANIEEIRAAADSRLPIVVECRGEEGFEEDADLLPDERGISVFRSVFRSVSSPELRAAPVPEIRTAYWLDAFWCDPHGIYLRGWIHAHEHRVRGLRIEAAGRSARVETFSDRPDLLAFYPEHEHVRHGGFAVYLACPPGQPVILTLETDGGTRSVPLPLPEGPLPVWPRSSDGYDKVSPMMRRFSELANDLGGSGGRLLQIGARTPRGEEAVPPRRLLQGRVIGLDIHAGLNVDVVGDAHRLSRFLREGSLDAVLSASVLEHLQAPWLLAAEINRVLKPGGLVYHQVPGAWPAHAQPNDFWRFSSEGLRVLFGPENGFEVLEAGDSGPAAIIPSPAWRAEYLDMPTVPAYAMAEILSRKVEEVQPGAVAWPLGAGASETRSRQYPVSGLRPASPRGSS